MEDFIEKSESILKRMIEIIAARPVGSEDIMQMQEIVRTALMVQQLKES